MIELIAGTAAGGITGLLGSLASKAFSFFERRQAFKEKQLEFDQELKLLELEHTFASREQEHEQRLAIEQHSADLRMATYAHDTNSGQAAQWVINVLRLVRPVLTIGLIGLAYLMPQTETLYLATTAVTWWFGDRGKQR